ncbi:MAG: penicillin-binding protein 2 [Chloroflexi bacterium]|nr:penicillin-binding protein 2 [Chloroflexota bacterium]
MLGRTDRRWRSVAILVVMCAFALAAVIRLAYWQVAMAPKLQGLAQQQMQYATKEHAIRGDIFDRNGRLLATTGYRDTLAGWPDQVTKAQRVATVEGLTKILDLDDTGRAALDAKLSSKARYAVLKQELTLDQGRAVRAGIAGRTLFGLTLLPHLVRIYPNPGGQPGTTLASQLLGFVTSADGDSQGHYGIEGQYNDALAGRPKLTATARDSLGRDLESSARVIDPGADGEDVTISIDASLQLQLEKELFAAWNADRSKRVSALVMDPRTGELLAWATVPGYDANDGNNADQKLVQDPIVTEAYEPGSVMKMLTAALALENKVVVPSTRIHDSVAVSFGAGLNVKNADHRGMGRITFRDVIAYSRNVAVSKVAARLGRNTAKAATVLYKTWNKLGIGRPSGVDVPGEVAGLAYDPRRSIWTPIDLANRAFGQGVTTTPIQLATAFTPMINGGMRVQPHFLISIAQQPQAVTPPRRVLTKKVSGQLQGILQHVTGAVSWYAKGSLIPRYQVGGKTGTAQIWRNDEGRWDPDTFNFSFVGYVGGDRPAAVVAVRIDEANSLTRGQGDITLNITSYQLFRRIAMGIIRTQEVKRSRDAQAGQPEPGSAAERLLAPERYARHARRSGRAR